MVNLTSVDIAYFFALLGILFGFLLFLGFIISGTLNSKTAMFSTGMLLLGLGSIVLLEFGFFPGFIVMLAGFLLLILTYFYLLRYILRGYKRRRNDFH
jgi:amino acid permease